MRYKKIQHGNTLTEYALLFGLLAIAAAGSLSLLGDNIAELIQSFEVQPASAQISHFAPLSFHQPIPISQQTPPIILTTSTSQPSLVLPSQRPPESEFLMTQNSSSGTNATSVDGNQQIGIDTVENTWAFAQKLSELASQTTDTTLKNYYTVLANDAYWLAGAQANFEYHATGTEPLKALGTVLDNGSVNLDTTISTIKGWSNTLQLDFNRLKSDPSIPASVKQEALTLAQQVLNKNQDRYSAQYKPNDSGTRLNTTDTFEQLKSIARQTLASGQADHSDTVKTSISNAGQLEGDEP